MKKWISMMLAAAIAFALTACGQTSTQNNESAAATNSQTEDTQSPETADTAGNEATTESTEPAEETRKVLVATSPGPATPKKWPPTLRSKPAETF